MNNVKLSKISFTILKKKNPSFFYKISIIFSKIFCFYRPQFQTTVIYIDWYRNLSTDYLWHRCLWKLFCQPVKRPKEDQKKEALL